MSRGWLQIPRGISRWILALSSPLASESLADACRENIFIDFSVNVEGSALKEQVPDVDDELQVEA